MVKRSDSDGRDQDACPGGEGSLRSVFSSENARFHCEERGCPCPFQGCLDANGSPFSAVRDYDNRV